ncbi:LysR family transcriptional regulator [Virgibacillus dokdonensis]|uniref:HTH-type transcriptional regulator GltC n=1 Tax=Virgibacillus dokdonensis TaxID=302167 RepID=A0A2K9IXZ9_9BACI|nr:LysR family transcriptional regulator [Virgibacillus dokdonensis]AUJ24304.1 HTH-type transcriptional regulator GltC [Virgibacillus dokdonensis]
MELRQIRYFVAIANSKSYSEAANNLFVTQPTLSWNIQKLEEELNVRLFYQTNQGLKLTEAGNIFYEKGKDILIHVDELTETIQQLNQKENKTLKVGLTVLFAIQYMKEIVHFTSTHPEVEVSLIQTGSIKLQKMLANKELDIGLLSFPIYEPSITIENLNTSNPDYSVAVVMPFNHPLAEKKSIQFSDLKGASICSFSSNYVLGKILHKSCQENGFQPNIIFMNDNWEVLLQNTLITGGVTLMPKALERLSNYNNLKWIPLNDKANYFKIGIAKRKNEHLKDIAIRFIDTIKKN